MKYNLLTVALLVTLSISGNAFAIDTTKDKCAEVGNNSTCQTQNMGDTDNSSNADGSHSNVSHSGTSSASNTSGMNSSANNDNSSQNSSTTTGTISNGNDHATGGNATGNTSTNDNRSSGGAGGAGGHASNIGGDAGGGTGGAGYGGVGGTVGDTTTNAGTVSQGQGQDQGQGQTQGITDSGNSSNNNKNTLGQGQSNDNSGNSRNTNALGQGQAQSNDNSGNSQTDVRNSLGQAQSNDNSGNSSNKNVTESASNSGGNRMSNGSASLSDASNTGGNSSVNVDASDKSVHRYTSQTLLLPTIQNAAPALVASPTLVVEASACGPRHEAVHEQVNGTYVGIFTRRNMPLGYDLTEVRPAAEPYRYWTDPKGVVHAFGHIVVNYVSVNGVAASRSIGLGGGETGGGWGQAGVSSGSSVQRTIIRTQLRECELQMAPREVYIEVPQKKIKG